MKKNNRLALLTFLTSALCAGAPALAQDFLNPVSPQAPTFASNGALNSGGAIGNLSNSSNLLTGPGAIAQPMLNGRAFSLPTAGNGLMAPNSVNNTPFPSGQYSYGFSQPPAFSINPLASNNQYGMYAGQSLPTVSTGSVDFNTVDCPYLRESYGTGSQVVNPFAININLPGLGTLNLQETAQSADTFLNNSVNSISGFFGN